MIALRNLIGDLATQFRRSGDLAARLTCVLRYWRLYVAHRLQGLSQDDSRLRTLAKMAQTGSNKRLVDVAIGDGLRAEMDVFSAAYLLREILDDGTYRAPGFVPEGGWTVVDVGAHQGIFTLDSARRVGPAGRVISVEPFPSNRELLKRNIDRNRLTQAEIAPFAAAEAAGPRTLYITQYATGGQSLVFTGDDRVPMTIDARPLDAILEERGIRNVDLLKIDVEGAWRLVFAGAPKLLAQRPRLVMEVEGDEAEVAAATQAVVALGYAVEFRSPVLFARPK